MKALEQLAEYSTDYAEMYDDMVWQFHLSRDQLVETDPQTALQVFLYYYGLNRAGAVTAGYPSLAAVAVGDVDDGDESLPEPDEAWRSFEDLCRAEGKKTNEPINRGVMEGAIELSNRYGNIFTWAGRETVAERDIEPVYDRIISIKGIGDKIARFFLCDVVWLWDCEDVVVPGGGHYLHPVDVWVRRIVLWIWTDLTTKTKREEISLRLAETCRENDLSNTRVNQGIWYFGAQHHEGDLEDLRRELMSLRGQ